MKADIDQETKNIQYEVENKAKREWEGWLERKGGSNIARTTVHDDAKVIQERKESERPME